jgi:uncharacterized membrane protein
MTREQFLASLRGHLSALPSGEVEEILRDQEEYIRDATMAGRSEAEVIQSLGDAATFAKSLVVESKFQKIETSTSIQNQVGNTFGAVVAVLALAPLNLIFVLGPFLVILALLFAGWSVVFAILMAAVGMLFGLFFKFLFSGMGILLVLAILFFSLGSVGIAALGIILMIWITKWIFTGTLAYLKWNVNFIRARAT